MKGVQMPNEVLNVSDARRTLPQLVHRVARGGRPVAIGPRGRAAAVLVEAGEYEALRRAAAGATPAPGGWKALRLEIAGDADSLETALGEVRREVGAARAERI